MQVTELKSQGLTKNYQVIVGADVIEAKTENELKEIGKTAKIAGFRSGQIPVKILQQRYGKAVRADTIKHIIDDSVRDIVKENKFRTTTNPQINVEEYDDGGELKFSVTLEIFPELPELVFDDITLERKTFEVTQNDIDEKTKQIAAHSPQFVDLPEDTKAENGNIVKIDFIGTIDNIAFDGGSAENLELELGSKQFIDGFEEQLVGVKAGDKKTVKVTFPAEYHSTKLAGKAAEFVVTVKSVQEVRTPEINEEFAIARGFPDLNALHEAVRNQIIKEHNQIVRNQLKKQLFDILEERYSFELPESLVDLEFKTIWERIKQSKDEGDELLAGKSEEELSAEYQKIARRRVTLGILLAEVGTRNKIQVSREDISGAVMRQAMQYPGQERQIIDFYKKNPDNLENLRGPILEEKAVDFILNKVKFNDSQVAIAELLDVGEE